jgi:hypothetical protein
MKLVTIFTAFNVVEADLIRTRLEAADFHAFLQNDNSALATGGYSVAVGGIHVQVPEDEAQDARELLDSKSPEPGNETD